MAKTIAQLRQEAQTIRDASAVGENTATRVGGTIEDVVDWLNDNHFVLTKDFPSADLAIADENDNVLAVFRNGEFIVKNFNSANTPLIGSANYDFTIEDENGNVLAEFKNGHIRTKNFNSAKGTAEDYFVVNRYKNKVLSILGDSISTFGTPDKDNAYGKWTYPNNRCRYPQNNLFTNVIYQYWYRIMDATGFILGINESWAGSRVSWDGHTESTDIGADKHIASLTRIGHLGENGNPDLILVYAGTNDVGHNVTVGTFNTESPINYTEAQIAALPVNTFADAYRTMLIRLQYYYPNSEIVCCFPNYTTSYYDIEKLDKYDEVVREACDFFGVKYIDLRTAGITILNRGSYLPDGIHPNAAGMEKIFNCIYKHLIYD